MNLQKAGISEIKIVKVFKKDSIGNTKGLAISTGMREAVGDFNLFIDADNATMFDDVLKFIESAKNGNDVVIASRYIEGAKILKKQSKTRIILSRTGNFISRLFLLPGVYDTQCGFKLFSKEATKAIFSQTTIEGWGADMEMLAIARYLGLRIKEIPVVWEAQDGTKIKPLAFLHTLKELWQIRRNVRNKAYFKSK
jgi:dolichyl-phosphate beta-glucosyltransferase